ncbi:MAG: DUF4268 domain-containing protein [Candidatus Aenigmatarchaeota archaeon]
MTKRAKIKNEKVMSQKVKEFLLHKHKIKLSNKIEYVKCDVVVNEVKLGGIIFDVVGYSKSENTFYVVECKIGTNDKDIGHAFGQILAYRCVLNDKGYEFFERFSEKIQKKRVGNTLTTTDLINVLEDKKIRCKFFVALRQKACNKYRLIRLIKNKFKEEVGVISFQNDEKCKLYIRTKENKKDYNLCNSEPVEIDFRRKYETKKEFLDSVVKKLEKIMGNSYPISKITKCTRYYQLRFGYAPFHFEIYMHKNKLDVTLDVEPNNRKLKNKFFDFIKNKKTEIQKSIDSKVIFKKNWLKGGMWGRIYEEISYAELDEELVEKVALELRKFIETLKPLVDKFYSKYDKL